MSTEFIINNDIEASFQYSALTHLSINGFNNNQIILHYNIFQILTNNTILNNSLLFVNDMT